MTVEFALTYIPRRMEELGYGNSYLLKFRHLQLDPYEQRELRAFNQLYILVEQAEEATISSELGTYDMLENKSNEIIYEHQGLITIKNNSAETVHIKFIQVIPKH